MADWADIRRRVAGKWQLPLLAVAGLAAASALFRIPRHAAQLPLPEVVRILSALDAGGRYDEVVEVAREALSNPHGPVVVAESRALVHRYLARALAENARRLDRQTRDGAREIVEHFQQAEVNGSDADAQDTRRLAEALEVLGQYDEAVHAFSRAADSGAPDASDLRRRAIELSQTHLHPPEENLLQEISSFLATVEPHRLDLRVWAVELKLELLDRLGRVGESSTLLVDEGARFAGSDFADHFSYLSSWTLYRTGHFDEAEASLRALRNRVPVMDELSARAGWLLGRVLLNDGGPQRPEEALSFFQDVLGHQGHGVYATACRVGAAEALSMLERHDDAISTYGLVIEDLEQTTAPRYVDREVLRATLSVSADLRRQQGDLNAAVGYARIALQLSDPENQEQTVQLTQQLARLLVARGHQLCGRTPERPDVQFPEESTAGGCPDGVPLFSEAAQMHLRLARWVTLNEREAAEAHWRAAELLALAGDDLRAPELYREFVAERPTHPLTPRAWLRIGQIEQSSERFESAIEAFRECFRRFPRTLDGARALVPLAECYLAQGGQDGEVAAERTLRIVLEESDLFTPEAPEFASALLALGEVQNRRGAYERSIATLTEFSDRFSDDPRTLRARYLMADSYRRSGLSLKSTIENERDPAVIERTWIQAVGRFRESRILYRSMIDELTSQEPGRLRALEQVYLRHAYLYEADGYFEAQEYGSALPRYEDAAAMFGDTPTSLSAYVRIIHCRVFLGEPEEARAALERAQVLVGTVPEQEFAESLSPERSEDWRRYFEWLGASGLF